MKSTRVEIIEALQTRQTASARELSRLLHLSASNIRHHLLKLQEEGLVIQVGKIHQGGRGRPTKLFSLARQRDNISLLASGALKALLKGSERDQTAQLKTLAGYLLTQAGGETPQGGHITQRLVRAIQLLNRLNYQARWEARADAPYLYLMHCPYREIIVDHPELCSMDAHLLERLLNSPVSHKKKLERDARGMPYCLFQV